MQALNLLIDPQQFLKSSKDLESKAKYLLVSKPYIIIFLSLVQIGAFTFKAKAINGVSFSSNFLAML